MTSRSTPLHIKLKKRFYPFVEQQDFERQKSTDPHFTRFRRVSGENVHVFEVQWDKYWPPYFVLNFGKGSAKDSDIPMTGRLQRRRGSSLSCWFSVKKPWLNRLVTLRWSYNPSEVVDELIDAFEELEGWWANNSKRSHNYITELPTVTR